MKEKINTVSFNYQWSVIGSIKMHSTQRYKYMYSFIKIKKMIKLEARGPHDSPERHQLSAIDTCSFKFLKEI